MEYRIWDLVENEMLYEAAMDNLIVDTGEDGYFYLLKRARFVPLMCTEKKDKNGKYIYSGDLTKVGGLIEVVRFGQYQLEDNDLPLTTIGFYTESKYMKSPFIIENAEDVEVIGNIYENKELFI